MTKHTVRKGITFLIAVIMMLPAVVWAQSEGFTLSGEVSFKKTGNIFIKLVTEEQFGDNEDEEDIPAEEQEGVAKLILKMSEQDLEQKKDHEKNSRGFISQYCIDRITEVVEEFIKCGDYKEGLARIKSTGCPQGAIKTMYQPGLWS